MADFGWLDTLVHVLHLFGAIAWVGGMAFLTFVLLPVLRRELPQSERSRLVRVVGRRFRMVEGVAILLLLGTGLFKLVHFGAGVDWWGSLPGRILQVKLTLVVGVVALGVLHGFVWGPALTRAREAEAPVELERLNARLLVWARVEFVLALAVVTCGALLRMNPF